MPYTYKQIDPFTDVVTFNAFAMSTPFSKFNDDAFGTASDSDTHGNTVTNP